MPHPGVLTIAKVEILHKIIIITEISGRVCPLGTALSNTDEPPNGTPAWTCVLSCGSGTLGKLLLKGFAFGQHNVDMS